MYFCKSCLYKTDSTVSYIKHCRVHSCNNSIACGVPGCNRTFKNLSTIYSHLSRHHGNLTLSKRKSLVQNIGVSVKCNVPNCEQHCSLAELVKHLKSHIRDGVAIMCPFEECGRPMANKSTFTSHLSVKHGNVTRLNVKNTIILNETPDLSNDLIDVVDREHLCEESAPDGAQSAPDTTECYGIVKQAFLKNLSAFFLKLQCRYFVPVSTVQMISSEFWNLHQLGMGNISQILKNRLSVNDNVRESDIKVIINEIEKENFLFSALNPDDGLLATHHKRGCFLKKNFRYIESIEVPLGFNASGLARSYHYVPLKETLLALLMHKTVEECLKRGHLSKSGVFEDLCDGEILKNISQTVENNASFCELILYQDAFEIVNPLGSAKKVHKIVAVYLALGNLPHHLRTSIDNLQLVLLCREVDLNYFGQLAVFERMLIDLKDLESNGIELTECRREVRLISMLGDNLGSHWIGGFCTNFSNNDYVCRYCLVKKSELGLGVTADIRTPENYNFCLSQLKDEHSYKGVTRESVLNNLQFFHVCMPGLAPCLGHDLFEGLVQFDLSLILKQLCKSKTTTFSFEHLNKVIKLFHFKGSDSNDKPGTVSNGRTVGGHAVQNWCLLRLLPFFVFDVIDINDDNWKLLLLLREVVELICAPKISHSQILYLNHLVQMYVEDRVRLFVSVPLRPKHHYLLHYPWLILMLGPLIRVWTMRMESKHTFFKRCARTSRNFINVTKTLSETHQLNQAFLSVGPLMNDDVCLGNDNTLFDKQLFATKIVLGVSQCAQLIAPIHCSMMLTFRGTTFKKDLFVVLRLNGCVPTFGKILLCLEDSIGTCGLVVLVCESQKIGELGLFAICKSDDANECFECLSVGELWDFYPLAGYTINGLTHIALKHAFFDTCI